MTAMNLVLGLCFPDHTEQTGSVPGGKAASVSADLLNLTVTFKNWVSMGKSLKGFRHQFLRL